MSHETTICKVLRAQGKLRRVDPNNPLLDYVKVHDYYTTLSRDFIREYPVPDAELGPDAALSRYADDMVKKYQEVLKKTGQLNWS